MFKFMAALVLASTVTGQGTEIGKSSNDSNSASAQVKENDLIQAYI